MTTLPKSLPIAEAPTWTVAELLESGQCTAQCLCAYDEASRRLCACPCRGAFHGRLSNKEVGEETRRLIMTRMDNLKIHETSADGRWWAWHEDRPNILGVSSANESARECLERLTEMWGHPENPPGYIYPDSSGYELA